MSGDRTLAWRAWLKRCFRYGVVVSALAVVLLIVLWWSAPVSFRLWVFHPVRELRFFVVELEPHKAWGRIERIDATGATEVAIPVTGPGQLDVVADLWTPPDAAAAGESPAILLLHGSSPWGRKAGLIQVLGQRFSERGWFCLAPDARGFGASEDPPRPDDPESWRPTEDVRRALGYLAAQAGVDPERLFVLGHSLGANHALEAAADDPRVRGMILIGPSRYPSGIEAVASKWNRVRFSADRRLTTVVPQQVTLALAREGSIALAAEHRLSRPGHVPILLIDGELEGSANLRYFAEIAARIADPIEYTTVPGAGHYCGVRSFRGGRRLYVRTDVLDALEGEVLGFLNGLDSR